MAKRIKSKPHAKSRAGSGQFVSISGAMSLGYSLAVSFPTKHKALKPIKAKFNPTEQELEAITEGAEELCLSMSNEEKFKIY